jgi:hypothetical protein
MYSSIAMAFRFCQNTTAIIEEAAASPPLSQDLAQVVGS